MLDISCYLLSLKVLGGDFIRWSILSTAWVSGFFKLWESFPPMLPNLSAYPLAAALLGLTAAGLVLLPVLSVAQGFFLSFSVGCFARALGRGGVYLALAAFGPRCLFVLPCTLLLTVQGLSAAARRRDGQKVRLTEGAYWRRVGLCGLILLIGAALELTFGPRLLQWVIARTL